MNIFGKKIHWYDFLPPIILKILKKLGIRIKSESTPNIYFSEKVQTFSQYNEDLVLDSLLKYKERGFYVDIGANDPEKFSNTKRFYNRGWYGINIDPDPRVYEKLMEKRTRDTNLNIGISETKSSIPFYIVSCSTISSFSKESAERNSQMHGEKIIDTKQIEVFPLKNVLEQQNVDQIDFMSVDTEGFDLAVLKSNDWKKFRPKYVIVETNQDEENINNYLKQQNYEILFTNKTNTIFGDIDL